MLKRMPLGKTTIPYAQWSSAQGGSSPSWRREGRQFPRSPFSATLIAQEQQQLRYTVVYSDERGVTHFRDEQLVWQMAPGTGNSPVFLTDYLDADKIGFLRLPAGLRSDWHPAPSKRFVMPLSGNSEIEVGDGERRTFAPGSIVLVTDVQGQGHRTNAVGSQDVLLAWVPIP